MYVCINMTRDSTTKNETGKVIQVLSAKLRT